MRINNNLMAMNTHRQLGINGTNTQKSIAKLSSGLRINSAADDAAGLAISEKMRGQIRGLNQASRNAQDGISLVQTAEGALQETQAILQRMRELAVQSANSTNADSDRSEIQNEMNQLTSEINRIANTTEFNTKKLLKGSTAVGEVSSFAVTDHSDVGTPTGAISTLNTTNPSVAAGTGAASTVTENNTSTAESLGVYTFDITTNFDGGTQDQTITVGGVTLTEGTDFTAGADAGATATAIAAALQSEGTYTASASGATITITETTASGGAAPAVAVGAGTGVVGAVGTTTDSAVESLGDFSFDITTNFTDGDTITIDGHTLTAGTDFVVGADTDATAAAIAAAFDAADDAGVDRFANAVVVNSTIQLVENAGSATGAALADPNVVQLTEDLGEYTFDVTTNLADGDVVNIGSLSLTAGTDFVVGADADATATAIAAAIDGDAAYTSSAAGSTITVTEAVGTASGSAPALSLTGPGATAGVYTVDISTNLAAGESITVGSVTLTEGTDFTLGADADATATAIATALTTEGTYTASASTGTITITEATPSGTDLTSSDISVAGAGGGSYTAKLQIGANTAQSFTMEVNDMRSEALNVSTADNTELLTVTVDGNNYNVAWNASQSVTNGTDSSGSEYALDVTSHDNATAAVAFIDDAITSVSAERSKLGAYQNRLEHTIRNLDASSENLVAAESRIRDVDMAKEMMEFTKNNILQQAAQAMLAQANQQPQGVLQLLR